MFLHIALKKSNPLCDLRRAQLGFVVVLSRARGRSLKVLACENNYNKWLVSNGNYISVCWFLQYFFQSQVRVLFWISVTEYFMFWSIYVATYYGRFEVSFKLG